MPKTAIAEKLPPIVLQFLLDHLETFEMIGQESIPKNTHPENTVSGWMSEFSISLLNVPPKAVDFYPRQRPYATAVILETDQIKFERLANTWKHETGKLSLVQKKAMHPSYQKIIGMGNRALPFIFRELSQRRDDWIWALVAITGKDDIGSPDSTFDQAVDSWLTWAKENRYLA
jgi:hypothetical protein